MNQTTALFILFNLFLLNVSAQEPGMKILQRSIPLTTAANKTLIRPICEKSNGNPLFIVNGIVIEEFELKNIDPNDIESIEILKDSEATAIYCRKPARGVVVITTKNANQRTITVKDILTGEPLTGASIDLIPAEKRNEAIHMIADSSGSVVTNKIVYGKEFELRVSRTGYKTFRSIVNSKQMGRHYNVVLEREYKYLEEVTIKSITRKPGARKTNSCFDLLGGELQCFVAGVEITGQDQVNMQEEGNIINIKLYPNPIMSSQKINIEFEGKQGKVTVRLFSLDYKLINAKEYESTNGINRISFFIDPQLSSGMYIIQLFDEKNYPVKSERLIVQ